MDTNPKHPLQLAQWLQNQQKHQTPKMLQLSSGLSPRTIKKYLWVASMPEEIKQIMFKYPEIFTTKLLINHFASRQRFFAKENWKYLRLEIARCIQKGADHKPRKALNYPKNRAGGSLEDQRKRQAEKKETIERVPEKKPEPVGFMKELAAQDRLRERCATWVEVGNGEIRIKYCGAEDLDRLVEIIVGPGPDFDRLLRCRSGS
jgi:hypothetical protein